MIVECKRCHSRYRLKRSILKGSRGAEVRCRKCGETFVVLIPRTISGTDSPVEISGDAVRHGNPLSPAGRDRSPARKEGIPPGLTRMEPPPDSGNAGLHDGIPGEVPARGVPESGSPRDAVPGDPPESVPAKSFDITGSIRPEPVLLPEEETPADPVSRTVKELQKKQEPDRPALVNQPVEWKEEGITHSSPGTSVSAPSVSKQWPPGKRKDDYPPDRYSLSSLPQLSRIAWVYLALFFIGGCTYLILWVLFGVYFR